jgi:pyruvate ferredoxin oxidoreductase alpha subunit
VAGWRAPFVLVNVSRAIAAPVTLESDHGDVLAARDSGFLQIHCATCQEVLDSVLLAYRLAEHPQVRLPAIVNLDGFTLSFTREPVEIPDPEAVRRFLPRFDPDSIRFRASEPISQAVAVLGGGPYSYFRYEMHRASEQALAAYDEVSAEFEGEIGRALPAVATHRVEDAEIVFLMIGSFATKALDTVERLRAEGWKVGLVRPRLLRPWPVEALRRALAGIRGVCVVDQNLSLGKGGVLHTELASALYGVPDAPLLVGFPLAGRLRGGPGRTGHPARGVLRDGRRDPGGGRTGPRPRAAAPLHRTRAARGAQAPGHRAGRAQRDGARRRGE